ncbi:hypothetical protein CNMCM8927_000224 [Aspergillus lentulus]|uniref:GST N-terminal domain-containing protein n=1 Tax=Aspergillus lentulus TaxID=293939 RepID=A0AAN5YJC0_ASPLE|nr:hypothetical protein CNMCM8060_007374 [Aspergillus lentulus]KAF4191611.1 hypothetical protein CNMCM8694_001640 [Aspergillus lentulus]KAF4202412.1 hypothetical protein CNMCM8927_000224 [Aspergillus lentulus]
MTKGNVQQTIWVWPRGLYPGQLVYYLKAKSLPIAVLHSPENPEGPLNIVPIKIDMAAGKLTLALPNTEHQPPSSLLPVMRIVDGDTTRILHQSTAVLQYLEDYYHPSQGYNDLSGGSSPELRAHVRAIVQLVTDAMIWIQNDIFHTREFAVTLGRISKEEQSAAASVYARKQWKGEMAKLDRWVSENAQAESISLSGALGTPNLADFTLLSAVELFREFFNEDILEGYAALEAWYKRYSESSWFVRREDFDSLGDSRFKDFFQG